MNIQPYSHVDCLNMIQSWNRFTAAWHKELLQVGNARHHSVLPSFPFIFNTELSFEKNTQALLLLALKYEKYDFFEYLSADPIIRKYFDERVLCALLQIHQNIDSFSTKGWNFYILLSKILDNEYLQRNLEKSYDNQLLKMALECKKKIPLVPHLQPDFSTDEWSFIKILLEKNQHLAIKLYQEVLLTEEQAPPYLCYLDRMMEDILPFVREFIDEKFYLKYSKSHVQMIEKIFQNYPEQKVKYALLHHRLREENSRPPKNSFFIENNNKITERRENRPIIADNLIRHPRARLACSQGHSKA